MIPEVVWLLGACALALALVVVALVLATLAMRRTARLRRELAAATAVSEALRERIADLEASLATDSADLAGAPRGQDAHAAEHTFVITHVGESDALEVAAAGASSDAVDPVRLDGRQFADIVARETIVKAAGLAHGVRRAMAPQTRNRIRFEMRREVKRSKRTRRTEMKQAWREYQARQRGLLDDGGVA